MKTLAALAALAALLAAGRLAVAENATPLPGLAPLCIPWDGLARAILDRRLEQGDFLADFDMPVILDLAAARDARKNGKHRNALKGYADLLKRLADMETIGEAGPTQQATVKRA